jgi:cation:H+ antiporter
MINILIAITSLIVLIKSADIFIDQSTSLAKKIKVSGFFIGFTLIALGTSLPDLVVSSYSTISGNQEIAISTFLGSVIVKTSLLLGVLALFSKYKLEEIDIKRNIPLNLGIYILLFALLIIFNFQMPWYLGVITISILIVATFIANKNNHLTKLKSKTKFNLLFLIFSFLLVILSGKFTVDYFVILAEQYNIAQTTIGYFVLAIGATAPELITSLTAIKKDNLHMSLGNILGASLFDILLVSGVSSFFATLHLTEFKLDFVFLIIATIIFLLFAIFGKKYYITKKEGIGLILVYVIFVLLQWV